MSSMKCEKCGRGIRADKGDGLCSACRRKAGGYLNAGPAKKCRDCGGRILRDKGDGLCSACRVKKNRADKRAQNRAARCTVCGSVCYKNPEDGLCSRCRAKSMVKVPRADMATCEKCGKRIFPTDKFGVRKTLCWNCEMSSVGTDVRGVHDARPVDQRAAEIHAKYGAAGERIREICRQDAEDRKKGKHISYGMRMAGKK